MEKLVEKSNRIIQFLHYPYQREVTGKINWTWRLNGIIGARGTGKTTLLLQQLKQNQGKGKEVLFVRLDDFYFADHSLIDLADDFWKNGGRLLYLDEVHKYPGWAREVKNIYDSFPHLKVAFSGSSIIEITKQEVDLSRRAMIYELTGLSFREYLLMSGILTIPAYTLPEILTNHVEIATEVVKKIPVLKHFRTYLKSGYFPYFLEPDRDYLMTLEQVIRTVMEEDLRFIENFDIAQSRKMLILLKIIAASAPFKPNVAKISQKAGLHRQTVVQYFHYLEMTRMIRLLNLPARSISRLQKPDKLFLDNPNLFYALNPEQTDTGSLRETFALNQLSVKHKVSLHETADFLVDQKYIIEIGGKNKTRKQVRGISDSYIAADDIEYGSGNKIPLWLFGFLY